MHCDKQRVSSAATACLHRAAAGSPTLVVPLQPAAAHPWASCLIGLELPSVAQAIWPLVLPMPMQQAPAEGATVSVAAGEHYSTLAMKQAIAVSFSLIAVCCHLSIQSRSAAVKSAPLHRCASRLTSCTSGQATVGESLLTSAHSGRGGSDPLTAVSVLGMALPSSTFTKGSETSPC